MKKLIIIALALLLLASCGGKGTGGQDESQASADNDFLVDGQEPISEKTVKHDFGDCVISVTVPEGWNDFVVEKDGIIEPQHFGIQLYYGEVPEQKELYGGKLFVAVAANGRAKAYVDAWADMETPFTEEVYTSESGAGLKLYYLDGKLDYATFDDYSELCVFFNLDDGDSMQDILKIVDSVKYESQDGEAAASTMPADDIPEIEETTVSDKEAPEVTEAKPAPITDSAYISAEEIKTLVDLSLQIGKYLSVESPAYDSDSPVQQGGSEYYPVVDESFDTWEKWEAYIRSAYTDKLAKVYLAYDSIINIDGKTHCNCGGRGYDLTDEYTVQIISDESEKVTVHVKNPSVWNDEEPVPEFDEKDYLLVKLDGRWKIEDIIF